MQYTVEPWSAALPEVEAHWKAHFAEVAIDHLAVPLDPDYTRYAALEAADKLLVVTARTDEGALVGYAVVILETHLHNKGTLCGFVDLYYLAPAYRTGWEGIRLFRAMEAACRARGVVKMFSGTKIHLDRSVLFQRLGWRTTEHLFTKLL